MLWVFIAAYVLVLVLAFKPPLRVASMWGRLKRVLFGTALVGLAMLQLQLSSTQRSDPSLHALSRAGAGRKSWLSSHGSPTHPSRTTLTPTNRAPSTLAPTSTSTSAPPQPSEFPQSSDFGGADSADGELQADGAGRGQKGTSRDGLAPCDGDCRTGIPVHVMEDHGDAIYSWALASHAGSCPASGLAIFHVDKHDDMELPVFNHKEDFQCLAGRCSSFPSYSEFSRLCARISDDGLIRNNNFQLTAVQAGAVDAVLWVYPNFECAICRYGTQPVGKCELLEPEHDNADFGSRPVHSAADVGNRSCHGGNQLLEGGSFRENKTRAQYQFVMGSITDAELDIVIGKGDTMRLQAVRDEWFGEAGWALDIDLDYLVPDENSPKMSKWMIDARELAKEFGYNSSAPSYSVMPWDDLRQPLLAITDYIDVEALRAIMAWLCPTTASCIEVMWHEVLHNATACKLWPI